MTDMTPKQIDAALKAGIIDAEQAKALRAKAAPDKPLKQIPIDEDRAQIGNEDDMRFVRSFSDVFIATGLGLFAFGLLAFGAISNSGAIYLLLAGLMWVQAEYFGKKKRAHLPTLIIALGFLKFISVAAAKLLPSINAAPGVLPALVVLGAMLLFYWRFRLPFCIALIAIALVMLAYSLVGGIIPLGFFLLLSGIALFASALVYDAKDTGRLTRFADNAFWLHFTAAPLILHGIAIQVLSLKTVKLFNIIPVPSLGKTDALIMLLIIGALALIGLAINRRALLVSSFGYAGLAIAMLIKDTGLDFGTVVAVTLLLLGGGIVFLGAGWHTARRGVLKVLPRQGLAEKIFPPVK